jgi:hypothetical protein
MYRNPYSQGIASDVENMNRRYVSHLNTEMMDSFEGSGKNANASKCPCGQMPCKCQYGEGMSGGSGYASATVRDLGFEPTIGAGGGKGSATYRKKTTGCGQIAALPPPENVFELGNVGAGAGMLGNMRETVMPDLKPIRDEKAKRVVGGKKPKAKKSGKGTAELKSDLSKFDFNRVKDWVGLGGARDIPQKVVERSVMQPVIGGKKPKGMGKSGGADGRTKRAEIVRKVMNERGVKMIEASKIVKAEGLY